MTLSPTTAYYIRRLMRQNLDRLKFVATNGVGIQADLLSDLNAVIQSLYSEPKEIRSTLFELERLVNFHKGLYTQAGTHQKEIAEVEQRMFWLLGFKLRKPEHRGTVLLVDDMPENLRLLTKALTEQGYEVSCAISGEMALNAIQNVSPDLILLDIRMPGMDGYEVCQQLKSMALTQDIPILFVSASHDVTDKVRAFELGGVDYVTKPFQIEEVLARIHHQLRIRDLQQRLETQNMKLEKQVRVRTHRNFAPGHASSDLSSSSLENSLENPLGTVSNDLDQLVNKLPVVIHQYCLDAEWTTLYISDAIQPLTGFSPVAFIHRKQCWTELIHPVDRQPVEQKILANIQKHNSYALEFRMIHRDGSINWVYHQGVPEYASDGSLAHIDSVLVNINPCKNSPVPQLDLA